MRSHPIALLREQAIELCAQAPRRIDDAPTARGAHAPRLSLSGPQRPGRHGSRAYAGTTIPLIAVCHRIEDLGRNRVDASALAPSTGGESPMDVLRYTEQQLLHHSDDITLAD